MVCKIYLHVLAQTLIKLLNWCSVESSNSHIIQSTALKYVKCNQRINVLMILGFNYHMPGRLNLLQTLINYALLLAVSPLMRF